jgi:hypothetical protein
MVTDLIQSITTSQVGLIWLSTTVAVSTAEFIKNDSKIEFKQIIQHMIASLVILIVVLLMLGAIDWVTARL